MGLREIRKSRKMSQRELAQQSGVNFRSLQDYEQGHKHLISASGDTLLRLSTALGCSLEDLLYEHELSGAPLLAANQLDAGMIQSQRFYCEKYEVFGRWICQDGFLATMFFYKGTQYRMPFRAIFTPDTLPWLKEAAVMQMEEKIEDICWEEKVKENW